MTATSSDSSDPRGTSTFRPLTPTHVPTFPESSLEQGGRIRQVVLPQVFGKQNRSGQSCHGIRTSKKDLMTTCLITGVSRDYRGMQDQGSQTLMRQSEPFTRNVYTDSIPRTLPLIAQQTQTVCPGMSSSVLFPHPSVRLQCQPVTSTTGHPELLPPSRARVFLPGETFDLFRPLSKRGSRRSPCVTTSVELKS